MGDQFDDLRDVKLADLGGLSELTWFSHTPLGHYSSLTTVSSGPVAILAGFSLTSAIAIATGSSVETLDALAIALLAVSAASLFVTLAFVAEANAYAASPAQRKEWFPEAEVSREILLAMRQRQRLDFLKYDSFRIMALKWYSVGAAAALMALASVILARADGSTAFKFDSLDDALLDAIAIGGALLALSVAGYVFSFAPFKCLDRIALRREDAALRKGKSRWPAAQDAVSTSLVDASNLRGWPSS